MDLFLIYLFISVEMRNTFLNLGDKVSTHKPTTHESKTLKSGNRTLNLMCQIFLSIGIHVSFVTDKLFS